MNFGNFSLRRRFLAQLTTGIALIAAGAIASVTSYAREYPSSPIRVTVPYSAGGMSDVSARTITAALGKELKETVVIENKPGAASSVASNWFAHQRPDGYSLYAAPISLVLNKYIQPHVGYDAYKDFAPISMMLYSPFVLQVNPKLGVKNLKDLIALIHSHPGEYAIGSSGVGSINDLAAHLLMQRFKLDLIVVPYLGGAPMSTALLGNQIQMSFSAANEAAPLIKTGKTIGIAVSSVDRLRLLPELPTVNEAAGITDFEAVYWMSLVAPKDTPQPIIDKLAVAMAKVGSDQQLKAKLDSMGVQLATSTPAQLGATFHRSDDGWADVIKSLNLKQE